ncbi:MAG: hypothetical protein JOZ41_13995 [Chloroflexi bacterium]|nr:hypothetical protein [Chloroflexota bacterium]
MSGQRSVSANRRAAGGHPTSATLLRVVPALWASNAYAHAFLNLLVFGLTMVAGTWIVHQTEYMLEYGNRFGAVMATGPHRLYMAPAGVLLAVVGVVLAGLTVHALSRARIRIRRLLPLVPYRLAPHAVPSARTLSLRAVGETALVMAAGQCLLYFLQENLESAALSQGWPALAVLLAPRHATVIPLHLLVALCSSLLLWTTHARLRRSKGAVQIARLFAAIAARRRTVAPRIPSPPVHLPNLRLLIGIPCLRSPPEARSC